MTCEGGRGDQRPQLRRLLEEVVEPLHTIAQPVVVAGKLGPLLLGGIRRQPRAGDVQRRQPDRLAGELPRRQSHVEGRDLRAAGVDLKAEEVVGQGGTDGVFEGQPFFLHPQPHEQLEALDEEVAAAAAGIEHLQFRRGLRPAVERTRARDLRRIDLRSVALSGSAARLGKVKGVRLEI